MSKVNFYLSWLLLMLVLGITFDIANMLDSTLFSSVVKTLVIYFYSLFIAHNAEQIKW